jgi:hypothetical protein
MKIYILILICLMAFAGVGFCQVDTMRLLEVGSVTAPGTITNWYFEDLNGDSIKEIILTTANSVNIYSGQSFAPIWSQEGFTNPQDLNFADINNDGMIDFSVKDTSHIYLIDPHHSTTIWTSPMLDSTYRCYTIGDRNGDGFNDIIIVRKEIFIRNQNMGNKDSVWIDIFDGPLWLYASGDTILVSCYHFQDVMSVSGSIETPSAITIANLSNLAGNVIRIILFSTISESWSAHGATSGTTDGNIRIIGVNGNYEMLISGVGQMSSNFINNIDGLNRLYSVGYYNHWVHYQVFSIRNTIFSVNQLSADTQVVDLPPINRTRS